MYDSESAGPGPAHDCHDGPASLTVVYELNGLTFYVEATRCCAETIPDTSVMPPGAILTEVRLKDANGETVCTPEMTQVTEYNRVALCRTDTVSRSGYGG